MRPKLIEFVVFPFMVEMNGHIFFPFQEKLKGLSQQENISTLNWFVDIFPEAFDLTLLNSLPFFFFYGGSKPGSPKILLPFSDCLLTV